uniref:Mitochondrial carrier protein n=1 Tax=Sexangularia sp. CB-2014 TaxID=1486929 RepID=A0A7S1VDI0_9EUKA
MSASQPTPIPASVNFAIAGAGGIFGWTIIHPANTLAVQQNLSLFAAPRGTKVPSFLTFAKTAIARDGFLALYRGLSAGVARQVFYGSSRFGGFNILAEYFDKHWRPRDAVSRVTAGAASGAFAALISAPAELCLVRMANDASLPTAEKRNYTSIFNAATRIASEEGVATFWRGATPFAQRAVLVGICQVATFDQFKATYASFFPSSLALGTAGNSMIASASSGLVYSLITMPLESSKNRMTFQKAAPDGSYKYRTVPQTIKTVVAESGVLSLWHGFFPYFVRCAGHSVTMFVACDWLRTQYMARRNAAQHQEE